MRPGRRSIAALALGFLAAGPGGGAAPADLVTFANGKTTRATVFREATRVRVNPYRSTLPAMTWGVGEHPPGDVKSVVPEEGAEALLAALDALALGDVAPRAAILARATRAKERGIARRVAEEILRVDPTHGPALEAVGGSEAWASRRRGDPLLDPALGAEVRRLLRLPSGLERKAAATPLLSAQGLTLDAEALERMARSLREERGVLHPVRLRGDPPKAPGGTAAMFVPEDLDPLVPRPLLLALHGGGPAKTRSEVVVGSGQEALSLFLEGARTAGFLVVAPTALEWPWTTAANEALLLAALDEVETRWNVDLDRVHVAGQGEGGDGALWFASRHAARFATVGAAGARPPLAASLSQRGVGVWLYHGEKDEVVPVEEARKAASALRKADGEFVYTELPDLGRGFPPQAEADYWRFATHRRRARTRGAWPQASFVQRATQAEIAALGPPAGAWGEAAPSLEPLRRGTTEAEPAARALLRLPPEGLGAEVAAVLRDRTVPPEGRAWAAWLLGERRDPEALDPLADAVRVETDPWLLGFLARALRRLGSPDATQDLLAALRDQGERYQRRTGPERTVPFFAFDRTCRTAADLVEALGTLAPSPETAADLEAYAVIPILRDGRTVRASAAAGEDPSVPRARLAEALGRAYGALRAEATLFDMLRVTLKADPAAQAAAARGAAEGLPRGR